MTDQELIEGLKRKERAAIHYLVNKYQRQVIKTAHYFLQDIQEAEDLSQEIFMDILEAAAGFRRSASVSTWIYRITVNKSLNQVKKINRRIFIQRMGHTFKRDIEESNDQTDHPISSTAPFEEKENSRILANAIGHLSDNQRIAFTLSKYDDLSYHEIADVMNLSISSVESLLHRAKMNLQKKLIQHFPEFKKQ